MSKFFRFLVSKTFVVNVILAILGGILFLWIINLWLDSYTRYGEEIVVPNLSDIRIDEAAEMLLQQELDFKVIDSAEFNDLYPPLAVIEQYPEADSRVKSGRVIMLTINPKRQRKIELPNIKDKTIRRALHDLESRGLEVGELIYVPDIARDVVIGIQLEGEEIEAGTRLEKGTILDLIVGRGLSQEKIHVPYLKFMNLEEAQNKIKLSSLNLGIVIYDETVEDSANAIVFKQYPRATLNPAIRMGSSIDLWLTSDSTKIENDSLLFRPRVDSLGVDSLITDTNLIPDEGF